MIPTRVGADQSDRSLGPVRRGIEAELPELRQRECRGRPWLADFPPFAGIEITREKGATRPLPILVLVGEEPGSPALRRHLGPLRPPLRLQGDEQVAHHLPTDRWVGVKEPVDRRARAGHAREATNHLADGR